jgi:hypothetical protein
MAKQAKTFSVAGMSIAIWQWRLQARFRNRAKQFKHQIQPCPYGQFKAFYLLFSPIRNKAMRVKGGGGCGLGLGALKAGGSKDLPAFVYENDPPGPFGFPGCLIAGRAQLSARQYAPSGGWGRAPPVKYLQSNISTTDEQFTSSSGYSPW